jgi:hypothetical protein
MITNRELPPETSSALPPGAVPIRTENASEHVAAAVAASPSDQDDGGSDRSGQIEIAYKFLRAMRAGRFEEGLEYADENWQMCRIQSWLWNNREHFSSDITELQRLAESLLNDHEPMDAWKEFVASEASSFAEAWAPLDPDKLGAASRRRRIARDYDLVILAPVGESGGYFVTTATAIPNAITFVMHHVDGDWLVANHVGTAPPRPGWPPAWWTSNDPAIEALTDDDG